MPPGPWSLIPLRGVSREVNQEAPHLTYTEWNRKYGDISFTMSGTQKTVILSSDTLVREAFVNKQEITSGKNIPILYCICSIFRLKWTIPEVFFPFLGSVFLRRHGPLIL